jgi:alcohol dehydrogenase class IV
MNAPLTGNWNYPTQVRFGPGKIAELPLACRALGMTRPLLVTDPGLAALAVTDGALDLLSEAGLGRTTFSDLRRNPVGEDIEHGVAAFRHENCDGVVAFGGGAAIDAGKAIALMAGQTRSIWDFEDRGHNYQLVDEGGMAPVVAVPTTAGTGSEVGRASVILDEEAEEKKIIFHPRMLPAIVISDPELTVGLPPGVTAATGLDAYTHCFEAFCAPGFHPMADGIAVEGMRLVAEFLPRATKDGADLEARAAMLAAASMGATAFQKGLGGVHALSHPIGALFDTHHGLTNAVVLPYVMVFNRPVIEAKAEYLARVLGLRKPGFEALLEWTLGLRERLAIPPTLTGIGVDASRATDVARMAERDPSAAGNPRPVTAAELGAIFRSALEGRL